MAINTSIRFNSATRTVDETILHQIVAVEDISTADGVVIPAGTVGGYAEYLDQVGPGCWLGAGCKILGNAKMTGKVHAFAVEGGQVVIRDKAFLSGDVILNGRFILVQDAANIVTHNGGRVVIQGNVGVMGEAFVSGNMPDKTLCIYTGYCMDSATIKGSVVGAVEIAGSAYVGPLARVEGEARLNNGVTLDGAVLVDDHALIWCNVELAGKAWISDHADVCGNPRQDGDAPLRICDNAFVGGYAHISGGNTVIDGNAIVGGNASIVVGSHIGGTAHVCPKNFKSIEGEILKPNLWVRFTRALTRNYTRFHAVRSLKKMTKNWNSI